MLQRPRRAEYATDCDYRRAVYRARDRALAKARHAWDYGSACDFVHAARVVFLLEVEIKLRREGKYPSEKIEGGLLQLELAIERGTGVGLHAIPLSRHETGFVSADMMFGETFPERWRPSPLW